jgi:sugar/nucleoside kinase (ribokinase family)
MTCDILLFGDYFCDVIITGLSEVPRLGADIFGESMEITPGGAYILAVALHRLDVNVCWAARLGNDLFSRFLLEESRREGLDTSLFQILDHPLRSISVSFSFSHDRGFISYADPAPEQDYRSLIAAQRPKWVYNLPFDGHPLSRALVDFAHQNGARVYTDCQYTTITLDEPGIKEMLGEIDIFAPNQSEAAQLTGLSDPQQAAAKLAEFCPIVIVKAGAHGAFARAGSQSWHSPSIDVPVIDTTGAGDSFNSGFMAAFLRGEPMDVCLRYGNICGGLSVTKRGGASAAPTLDELKSYL